jgi:hypothetical protein
MDLRYDPDVAALMAAELARDNSAELGGFLGRQPDSTELYLAHFLGAAGARGFLGALQSTPQASAASLFPKPAEANRGIFFEGGRARSVAEVMDLLRTRVSAAMRGGDTAPQAGAGFAYSTPASSFAHAAASFPQPAAPVRRVSMAETLQAAFGGSEHLGGRAARRVDEAYGKFRAFDL